jgi:hypothetical protein
MHLCEAAFGTLLTYDGERFAPAAYCGVQAPLAEWQKHRPPKFGPDTAPAQIVGGENLVHTVDLMATEAYNAATRAVARLSTSGVRGAT